MTHRRYQLVLALGSLVLALFAAACLVRRMWWEAGLFLFVAVFLAEGSTRSGRAHRTARARTALGGPCCGAFTASRGAVHGAYCLTGSAQRPADPKGNLTMAQYLDHTHIAQKLLDQQGEIDTLKAERDGAYRERAHLVALLAGMTDGAVLAPANDVPGEPGWQIVYLTIGGRQASWHISPRDADLFAQVPHVPADDPRARWDGHTTADKYAAIDQYTGELWRQCGPARAEIHQREGRCRA